MGNLPIISGVGIKPDGDFIIVGLTRGEQDNLETLFEFKLHKDDYKNFPAALLQIGKQLEEKTKIDLHLE